MCGSYRHVWQTVLLFTPVKAHVGKHEPCASTNTIEDIPEVNELPVDDTVTNTDAAFVKDFQPTLPSIVTNPVAKCTQSFPLSTIEYLKSQ